MGAYIIRRVLWTPILLAAVSFITFTLGFYGPGDPVQILMGQYQNPEVIERIREHRGLDESFLRQYTTYVSNALRGDFGESFKFRGRSVGELITKRIWVSSQLGLAAMFISVILGLPLGFIAALRQGSWIDTVTVSSTLLFIALPSLITAPFLLIIFVLWLGILPSGGWGGLFDTRIILPALVLGIPGVAILTRLTRASTLEVLGQDYVRTAWAKGLTPFVIYRRHILRNALIPVFTVIGLSLGTLVEGSFITEGIFGIPGIGLLGIDAFFARDYPLIMALTIILASSFVIANLIVDIGYRLLDPRIQF